MPKYKVGDMAALFPNPAKPKTKSGEKLQALFNQFYRNSPKQAEVQHQSKSNHSETIETKPKVQIVDENKPKKIKRKFQNTPTSIDNTENTQVVKKPKLEAPVVMAPFPRSNKKSKQSYLVKNRETYSEPDEEILPTKKSKQKTVKFDQPSPKKHKKSLLIEDTTNEDVPEPVTETESSESKKERKRRKKKEKAANQKQDAEIPDFLKLEPRVREEHSKVVFRMKKKRNIPSCKDIFENEDSAFMPEGRYYSANQKPGKIRKERVEDTEERLSRTLFVGNLPVNTNKKDLMKLFNPFGSLQSCRLRGAVPQKSSVPRKVAGFKGKFHDKLHSRIAFVVLQDRKSATQALSLAGTLIDGHHIVVDHASISGEKKLYDAKRSIFVGNLPFEVKDDTLWNTFLPCGEIEFVRVIRDKTTGLGKGFGYISFTKIQGKEKALSMANMNINGRKLRIQSVQDRKGGGKNVAGQKVAGGGKTKNLNSPPKWKSAMKRLAKKEKANSGNPNSRKTLGKLMNKGKQQRQKKKIASIFKKFSKN